MASRRSMTARGSDQQDRRLAMPLSFTSSGDYPIGDDPVDLAVADLNGDGTPDIVTVNRHDGTLTFLRGNGDGTFSEVGGFPIGSFPAAIEVADLNGDGAADLVVAAKDNGTVDVVLGDGNGGVLPQTNLATADTLPLSVGVGDLNGDGKLDLVSGSAMAQDGSVSVFLGNGNGTFQGQVPYSGPGASNAVALADLNGDGKADLVAVSSFTSVLLGNGDGTFQTPYVAGYGGYSVAIADLNADGKLDLVKTQGGSVLVQLGNGDGTFSAQTSYADGPGAFRVAIADLDGDGRPDLAVSGDTSVQVLLGNGDGTFQSAQKFSVDLPHALAIADLNNDGKPDIATVNATDTVSILFNTTPFSNAPPVAHDDSYTLAEDTALTLAAPAILGNDSDADGDTLSAALVSGPAHGSLALNANGALTYTPDANFNGTDSFTYKVNDGQADSSVATAFLRVTPVNDPPVAHDDSYTLAHDTPLTIKAAGVLANDSDLEGDPLSAILVGGPTHGNVLLTPDGAFTYTPAAGFGGTDSFTYKANDGQADSNIATVNLTITSANHAPVANDDSAGVAKGQTITADVQHGVLANDTDPDGNSLSVSAINGSAANVGHCRGRNLWIADG